LFSFNYGKDKKKIEMGPLVMKHPLSLERGESKDHTNIKIFSIECKIVEYEDKQEETKFSRQN